MQPNETWTHTHARTHTHAGKARHGRTRHLRELGGLFKNDICSSWAAWLKAELRQACIRHPAVGTALHIYKQLIIKELYVALQNIRGLIARCSLRGWGGHLLLPFFFSFFLSFSFFISEVFISYLLWLGDNISRFFRFVCEDREVSLNLVACTLPHHLYCVLLLSCITHVYFLSPGEYEWMRAGGARLGVRGAVQLHHVSSRLRRRQHGREGEERGLEAHRGRGTD